MTLFGSSARLIVFITSQPPPSSIGTRSTSPARTRRGRRRSSRRPRSTTARDLALRVDPGGPGLVVEPLLPDADVDLRQVVAPRLERAVRVGEHPPVVEHVVPLDVARSTIACHFSRTSGSFEYGIAASSQCQLHRRHLAVRACARAAASRSGRGGTPSRRCEISSPRYSPPDAFARSASSAWPPARTSSRVAVQRERDHGLGPVGLRDVRLVVAAQVARPSTRRTARRRRASRPRAGELAGRPPGVHVVVVGEERRELGLGPLDQLERRLGDDAERSLVRP